MKLRTTLAATGVAAMCMPAASAGAMTISMGKPTLYNKVAISEPVTVSCSPFDPGLVVFSQGITVSAQQASGRSMARGSGSVGVSYPCDGSQSTFQVTLFADTAGPPFHGGPAVLAGYGTVEAGTPSPWCSGCYTDPFESQGISEGPVTMNLQ